MRVVPAILIALPLERVLLAVTLKFVLNWKPVTTAMPMRVVAVTPIAQAQAVVPPVAMVISVQSLKPVMTAIPTPAVAAMRIARLLVQVRPAVTRKSVLS